jgi:hypothetical protein
VLRLENTFSLLTSALPQDSLTRFVLLAGDSGSASDHLPVVSDFIIDYTNETESPYSEDLSGIGIYPVPFRDFLNLDFGGIEAENSLVVVTDHHGKIAAVLQQPPGITRLRLDTSSWPPGVYLICLYGEKGNKEVSKAIKVQ